MESPVNSNYAATVIEVKHLVDLPGCDNIVGLPVHGLQAIVGKDTAIGTLGIIIPCEAQLSDEFCRENDLYRHADRNKNPDKVGYFEDNRRVRAIKLRGHRSDALFMPLLSLDYTGLHNHYVVGDTFDTVNGHEICRKYVIHTREPRANSIQKKLSRVEAKYFPEHLDTDNFARSRERLDLRCNIVASQKLHGTSIRIANIPVKKQHGAIARLIGRFFKLQQYEYAHVYGSRKVTKDANIPGQNHYYGEDIYTLYGRELDDICPRDYLIFGELIGWTTTGMAIQKNYTYNVPANKAELYVYRVAHVNHDGLITDLSFDQMVEFCEANGLLHVFELWRGKLADFSEQQFLDTNYVKLGYNALPIGKDSPCDEGVVVRLEKLRPEFYKAKSPLFLQHETRLIDAGIEDMESADTDNTQ